MTIQCPKDTPWGRADTIKPILDGLIWKVYTPGHGGWWIAPDLYATMPDHLKTTPYSKGGWFEEDCDWAIPCLFFWGQLQGSLDPRYFNAALQTLQNCYDGRIAKHFTHLQPILEVTA